ncbi:aminotransferase class IV [Niabella insulamsoli]|uniref:aminotransferase class IV n=1 Tax=Niabella insulamsoli TaxID=3144874 RepID=UPI0031FD8C23
MAFICFNGQYHDEQQPILKAANKSYRYGDGFFETIKVWKGRIVLAAYHEKRILNSLEVLQYKLPPLATVEKIFSQLIELCKKNKCLDAARVRLSFSNGDGGLFDENRELQYIIESWPLPAAIHELNENGLVTGIFPWARKSCDRWANLKSASALMYSAAATYAKQHQWNDSFITNQYGRICETTIANLFWIKNHTIFTPPLTEGCVSGVMRAYLIDSIKTVSEKPCQASDLIEADEVFLTNAIRGIKWVKSMEAATYQNKSAAQLVQQYILPLH